MAVAAGAAKQPGADTSVAAQPGQGVLMSSVVQALLKISGCVLRQSHPTRPQSGATFVTEMSIFGLYRQGAYGLWSRPGSGFEKRSPALRTIGKADYRDAALPFFTF